jgi:protein ImuB
VSARVQVEHGRPLSVRTERQNLQGGHVRACAGPWRTSGEWWKTPGTPPSELDKLRGRAGWNRDEWDVALSDGGIYRIFEDRDTGRWFVDGMVD